MRFLPIVERELRTAARRRGVFSARLLVTLAAILTSVVIFLIFLDVPPTTLGRYLFRALSILCLIYCVASGRLSTADCLSEEKREGTLGLLFLTDLKGYDVVLGKLVATSLGAFYGLLAILPVLAVPMLLGGISNAEFWRGVLVLVDTFLFSLAIGMFGSSITREARWAMAANFSLVLLLMVVLPLATALFLWLVCHAVMPEAFVASPFVAFYNSADAQYNSDPGKFWWPVVAIHVLTWLLLALTNWIVPRTWQDRPAPQVRAASTPWRALRRFLSYGQLAKQASHRKKLLDRNAYYWLAARARLKPIHTWICLGLMAAWWTWSWLNAGIAWYDPLIGVTLAAMLNFCFKVWIAIEAGQQLAEDQKAGALELLLSTPLTVRDILHGQWLALRRQFLKPLLLVIAIEFFFMYAEVVHRTGSDWKMTQDVWLAAIIMLLADSLTLSVVAMRVALTAKSPNRASISTISRILILPWVLFGIGVGMAHLWAELFSDTGSQPGWRTYLGLWFGAGLAVDLIFGFTAWRQLHGGFRQLATRQFAPARKQGKPRPVAAALVPAATIQPVLQSAALPTAPAGDNRRADPTETPAHLAAIAFLPKRLRNRKAVLFGAVAVLLAAWAFWIVHRSKPTVPPLLVVSITQSNAPLRVSHGPSFLAILPDGALWRLNIMGGAGGMAGMRGGMASFMTVMPAGSTAIFSGPGGSRVFAGGRVWTSAGQLASSMTPERVGTNSDWLQAVESGPHGAGVRQDGTLWEWGMQTAGSIDNPQPVDSAHDWASVSVAPTYFIGLKHDGTLWARGNNSLGQLGIGSGLNPTDLVQIGTNHDWIAIQSHGPSSLGLRADGTLWAWGASFGGRNLSTPTQVSCETNWAALGSSGYAWAQTRSGDVWEPIPPLLNSAASTAATCNLIASNTSLGRIAEAVCAGPMLYEVRPDGTLWQSPVAPAPGLARGPAGPWGRVGNRSDWVALWGSPLTALGLTADGTLWTWGLDARAAATPSLSARLKMLQVRIERFFGLGPAPVGATVAPVTPSYRKDPTPVMRILLSKATPANTVSHRPNEKGSP
jgi:ABC-2 family transporter protein